MQSVTESIKSISMVGSSPIIFIVAGIVLLYFLVKKDYLRMLFTALSLCSGLYSAIIKSIFKLERPEGYLSEGFIPWERVLKSEVYSFPSTHTVFYTAFFGYLIYLSYSIKGLDKLTKHATRIFCAFMVLLVGGSRVLLGAHYVRDVVAGYIFGLLYLGLLIAGERFLAQRLLNTPQARKKR